MILLLQEQEEQEFPVLSRVPGRKTEEQSSPCCAQAEQELLGWLRVMGICSGQGWLQPSWISQEFSPTTAELGLSWV